MLILYSQNKRIYLNVVVLAFFILFFFTPELNATSRENVYNNTGTNFNEIISETTGGILCATLFGYTFAYFSGSGFNDELFQSPPDMALINTYLGIEAGSAIGVYLAGKLTGADGSLLKTFVFASIIGGGVQALSYSLYYNNYKNSAEKPNTAVIQLLSIVAPVVGAVIGYNTSNPGTTYRSRAFLNFKSKSLSLGIPGIYMTKKMNTIFQGVTLITISI